jgi:hypothetical protein
LPSNHTEKFVVCPAATARGKVAPDTEKAGEETASAVIWTGIVPELTIDTCWGTFVPAATEPKSILPGFNRNAGWPGGGPPALTMPEHPLIREVRPSTKTKTIVIVQIGGRRCSRFLRFTATKVVPIPMPVSSTFNRDVRLRANLVVEYWWKV